MDSLKVQIKTREQAIKLESAQGIIKQIYAGSFIKFTIKGVEQIAKVGYINLTGCSVTTIEGTKKFVEFERVLEVLDSMPVEEKPVEVPVEVTPIFGKKNKK